MIKLYDHDLTFTVLIILRWSGLLIYGHVYVCRQYSVGFEMVTVSTVGDPGSAAFQKKSSGDYRYGIKTPAFQFVEEY